MIASLKKNPIIRTLASIRITVICLILLFILTFWGTVSQVTVGLYESQERFFNSWYFLVGDFFPFPGAQLVLWVLFINLCAVSITRFVYRWSHLGILVIHLGLLTYFVGAFVTLHFVEESNITLLEGESSNVSASYHDWELSVWQPTNDPTTKDVWAYDSDDFKSADTLRFNELGFDVIVKAYHRNAQAFVGADQKTDPPQNASGITEIARTDLEIEPEKNFPGALLSIKADGTEQDVILFGKESRPTRVSINGTDYHLQLRRKRYELPIQMTLERFEMEKHPGTEIASSYRSFVEFEHADIERRAEIYMNHPLRFKNYTFYQASYSIDSAQRIRSTLAVVKNFGRLLPYVSSLVTFAGLAIHFLVMAFKRKKR